MPSRMSLISSGTCCKKNVSKSMLSICLHLKSQLSRENSHGTRARATPCGLTGVLFIDRSAINWHLLSTISNFPLSGDGALKIFSGWVGVLFFESTVLLPNQEQFMLNVCRCRWTIFDSVDV